MRMTRSSLYPEQQLRRRAMGWAVKLKVNPEQVHIKRLPEKWGSCAPDGIVTFSDDLATEAEEFQDYVIVHELLHLRYRDHGRQFKAMMTALVPNWRELEKGSRHAVESATPDGSARGGSGA
jgi:predicted metal-dependent hydrolase